MNDATKQLVNFCPQNCGRCGADRAGSMCSLGQVLSVVAQKTDPDTFIPALFYLPESNDGNVSQSNNEGSLDIVPMNHFFECRCSDGEDFRQVHDQALDRLHRQLMSFPKPIRRELLYFFFKKLMHEYDLLAKCNNREADFEKYGAMYLSNAVKNAHYDYGELMYSPDDGHCMCHGTNVH